MKLVVAIVIGLLMLSVTGTNAWADLPPLPPLPSSSSSTSSGFPRSSGPSLPSLPPLPPVMDMGHPPTLDHSGAAPLPSLQPLPPMPVMSLSNGSSMSPTPMSSGSIVPQSSSTQGSGASASGFDTQSLSKETIGMRGNWMKKREWVAAARELQDEVTTAIHDIQKQSESLCVEKANKFDNDIHGFYQRVGVKRGENGRFVKELEKVFFGEWTPDSEVKRRDGESDADFESRLDGAQTAFFAYRNDLDQVKVDLETLSDLDKSIDERINKLEECVQGALDKSVEVHDLVAQMFPMIDHEKARTHYYKIEGLYEYIKALRDYIKGAFSSDFNSSVDQVYQLMKGIEDTVGQLEKKYGAIKTSVNSASSPVPAVASGQNTPSATTGENPPVRRPVKQNEESGLIGEIFSTIIASLLSVVTVIIKFITGIFSIFGG